MSSKRWWMGGVVAWCLAVGLVPQPASASVLIRASLENLVANHETVVVGEVIETRSYWNEDESFILTDAKVEVSDVLKGDPNDREITVTLMGGKVGDRAVAIVGGAQLTRGKSYVLFIQKQDLPVVSPLFSDLPTVPYQCQGVFEIGSGRDGLRAISQASKQELAPDAQGLIEAPGRTEGMPLESLIQSIRDLASGKRAVREVVR